VSQLIGRVHSCRFASLLAWGSCLLVQSASGEVFTIELF